MKQTYIRQKLICSKRRKRIKMPQGRACSDRACKHNRTGTKLILSIYSVYLMFTHTAEHPKSPFPNLILRQ